MPILDMYYLAILGTILIFLVSGVNLQEPDEVNSGCGNAREIRGPEEGELLSHPGYGRSLAPLNFCEWILRPPRGRYVSLTIEDMGNISCITQLFVYTHLGGERYPGWNLCGEGTFPLHGVPHHLASRRGTWLRILYRGNKITERTTGFSAKYSFQEPGCSGSQRLTGAPWWLASHPGAGSWAVEAGSVCSWTITAPYGQYVALKRGPVDLHCVSNWQSLSVHDGQAVTNSSLIVMLSCTREVSPLASSGRFMHLVYVDRWASNSLGFNISFEFYKSRQSGCGGDQLLSSPSGYILSHLPASGSTYSPLSRCQWRVLAPPGTRLNFQFELFDLTRSEQDIGCNRDLLVFHDGIEGAAASHVYCSSRSSPPRSLTSRFHMVDAYFSTETMARKSMQGRGFIIKYNRMCFEPQPVPNAKWISPDENKDGVFKITYGESVRYACMDGFVLERGDTIRRCTEAGILTGRPPICKVRQCVNIPQPPFCNLEVRDINMDGITKVTFREILLYTCVTGYTAVSGDSRRHCMTNGSLSGQDLKCQAAHCPLLPSVPHTTVVTIDSQQDGEDVVSFGEKVIYTCDHGYMEASGSSMRLCQADGSYSGEDLICEARVCGEAPKVGNTSIILEDSNDDGDRLSYPESALYHCIEGYQAIRGDHLRSCTAEGIVNGTGLICRKSLNSLSPAYGKLYPMTKPAALGTAIALCFFILLMIALISVILVRIRRRKVAAEKRTHQNKLKLVPDITNNTTQCSVFTLPRQVTTPWNTAPQLQGRRRDELVLSRGPFYFRWPMYLEDFKVEDI